MRPLLRLPSRPTTAVRHRTVGVVLAAAALATAALTGCGSSGSESDGAGTNDAHAFCSAVDEFVDASKTGDRTGMVDALDEAADDLSGDDVRDVEAYVQALRSSPANEAPDGDGVESDATDEAFRRVVADTCGDDVELPDEADATTTSSTPASSGGGGGTSTDDTGVDGGGMGTDTGSGGDTGGGM